jgi:hypothetical protein
MFLVFFSFSHTNIYNFLFQLQINQKTASEFTEFMKKHLSLVISIAVVVTLITSLAAFISLCVLGKCLCLKRCYQKCVCCNENTPQNDNEMAMEETRQELGKSDEKKEEKKVEVDKRVETIIETEEARQTTDGKFFNLPINSNLDLSKNNTIPMKKVK